MAIPQIDEDSIKDEKSSLWTIVSVWHMHKVGAEEVILPKMPLLAQS